MSDSLPKSVERRSDTCRRINKRVGERVRRRRVKSMDETEKLLYL